MKAPPKATERKPMDTPMEDDNGKHKGEPHPKTGMDKKPFMGHGCRRTKKQLRIDFATATNPQQAQSLWYEVMTTLRNIDKTMLIHNPMKYNQTITYTDDLPKPENLSQYTCIVRMGQHRQQQTTYSGITTSPLVDQYTSSNGWI